MVCRDLRREERKILEMQDDGWTDVSYIGVRCVFRAAGVGGTTICLD